MAFMEDRMIICRGAVTARLDHSIKYFIRPFAARPDLRLRT